ncbi:lysozyme inhibitor LprI family protein [Brunnivagina elsteri]|uniref:Lysozyme inhibitor LprI-like N-terminal domain-containing protein n=1 Tax=Brunnivagina elsteri CCALA 953 TaxID=987040 RepID=A0A2A2TLM0_9CYAN|nr:lysozyme inhibitor LprI family protein [Calothrix elsteri]PAX57132.1 hypothetical protein CK510_09345 [Calothrix elsteri CCALA 953]
MHLLLLFSISIITFSSLAIVSTTNETAFAQKLNCNDSTNLNQSQMNECAYLFYQSEDKKLNQAYKKVVPTLPASRKQKLIAAQQAWIKFRDASCDFERSETEGGSISPLIYYGCMQQLTKVRTGELINYLSPN